MPIDRERRVIGYWVVEIEATKPAVRKVKLDLLAATGVATAHDVGPVADHLRSVAGNLRRNRRLEAQVLEVGDTVGANARLGESYGLRA